MFCATVQLLFGPFIVWRCPTLLQRFSSRRSVIIKIILEDYLWRTYTKVTANQANQNQNMLKQFMSSKEEYRQTDLTWSIHRLSLELRRSLLIWWPLEYMEFTRLVKLLANWNRFHCYNALLSHVHSEMQWCRLFAKYGYMLAGKPKLSSYIRSLFSGKRF